MKLGDLGCAIGRGLMAGLVATATMTVSITAEMKPRGRQPSTAPADASLKLLRLQVVDDQAKARVSNLVHWGYGTSWGVLRGVLDAVGCESACAIPAHFTAIWGA